MQHQAGVPNGYIFSDLTISYQNRSPCGTLALKSMDRSACLDRLLGSLVNRHGFETSYSPIVRLMQREMPPTLSSVHPSPVLAIRDTAISIAPIRCICVCLHHHGGFVLLKTTLPTIHSTARELGLAPTYFEHASPVSPTASNFDSEVRGRRYQEPQCRHLELSRRASTK